MARNVLIPIPMSRSYEQCPWPENYTVEEGDTVRYIGDGRIFIIEETKYYGDLYQTNLVGGSQHIFEEKYLGYIYLPVVTDLGRLSVQGLQEKK